MARSPSHRRCCNFRKGSPTQQCRLILLTWISCRHPELAQSPFDLLNRFVAPMLEQGVEGVHQCDWQPALIISPKQ